MATNNRLVNYNHRLMYGDSNRLNTFISKLNNTSNVTYYSDKLRENLRTIPIAYRNAEEIFLAGAIKTGAILGYDINGNIIEMPFTRASNAWGIVGLKVKTYSANNPVLSDLYYGSRRHGICIESLRTNYGAKTYQFLGNASGLTVASNTSMFGSTVGSFTWLGEGTGTSTSYGDTTGSASNGTYGVVAGWNSYTSIEFWLGLQDLSPTRCVRWHPNYNGQQNFIDFDTNYNIISDTLNRPDKTIQLTKFDYNGKTYAKVIVDFKGTPISSQGNMSFGIWDKTQNAPFPCDSTSKFLIGNVKKNDLDQTLIISSSNATVTKQEDSLSFNLMHLSDIFISTSKGNFEFLNQPIGSFNYKANGIIDCKIYSIAIKYK